MSMLAEPKNRFKYSVNPRGLDWVNDESKFGQKLMEKMGWTKGEGLGANKDGNTDHIHVAVKIDKRGVGCNKKATEEWLDHQDGFSDILQQLNDEHVDPVDAIIKSNFNETGEENLLSLEHKSKNSIGRVHYQKFTKSKDLSVKRPDELDCIFGRKARKKTRKIHINSKHTAQNKESDFGVQTSTSALSSSEYFASKLRCLQEKSRNLDLNLTPTEANIEDIIESQVSNDLDANSAKKSEIKKSRNLEISMTDVNNENIIDPQVSNDLNANSAKKSKIKKSHNLDVTPTDANNENIIDPQVSNDLDANSGKKSKIKKSRNLDTPTTEANIEDIIKVSNDLDANSGKKSKIKESRNLDTPTTEENNEDINVSNDLDANRAKKSKIKKSRNIDAPTNHANIEAIIESQISNDLNANSRKKSKIKKFRNLDTPTTTDANIEAIIKPSNGIRKSKTKKKKVPTATLR